MRTIQDRKIDIPDIFSGINKEINKIKMHLAERNPGKAKEWPRLQNLTVIIE